MNNKTTIYQVLVVDRDNRIVVIAEAVSGDTEKNMLYKKLSNDIHNGKFYITVKEGVHHKRGDKI